MDRPATLAASALLDEPVVNRKGIEVGTLREIVIDLDRREVAYALLSRGGWIGVGEKLHVLPWTIVSHDHGRLIVDLDPAALDESPGYEPGEEPPELSDPVLGAEVHARFGAEPYWERTV
jgi:sporulation protein YlmC with PRC-barrel domain